MDAVALRHGPWRKELYRSAMLRFRSDAKKPVRHGLNTCVPLGVCDACGVDTAARAPALVSGPRWGLWVRTGRTVAVGGEARHTSAARGRAGRGAVDDPARQSCRASRPAPPDAGQARPRRRGDSRSTRGTIMDHLRQRVWGRLGRHTLEALTY